MLSLPPLLTIKFKLKFHIWMIPENCPAVVTVSRDRVPGVRRFPEASSLHWGQAVEGFLQCYAGLSPPEPLQSPPSTTTTVCLCPRRTLCSVSPCTVCFLFKLPHSVNCAVRSTHDRTQPVYKKNTISPLFALSLPSFPILPSLL